MRNFINFLKYLALIILTLGAALLYFYLGERSIDFELDAIQYIFLGLCVVIGFFLTRFLHTVLHELGHLIFGAAQKFEFCSFRVGRLHLRRDAQHKVKFCLGRRSQYAGNLLLVSRDTDRIERRYLLLSLGGLVGSLFAVIAFSLFLIFHAQINVYVYYLFGIGFPVSVYILLLNAIPFYRFGAYTDGALVSSILQKDPSVQYALRLTMIQSLLFQGMAPAELPEACFEGLPVVADNDVNKLQFMIYTYARALDLGDLEAADRAIRFLEENFEDLPDIFQDSVKTDIFFHMLTYRRQVDEAKNLYITFKSYIEADLNICNLRIRMAYELYGLSRPRLAIATAKTALSRKDDYILPGIARMEEKLLGSMMVDAEALAEEQLRQKKHASLTPYQDHSRDI